MKGRLSRIRGEYRVLDLLWGLELLRLPPPEAKCIKQLGVGLRPTESDLVSFLFFVPGALFCSGPDGIQARSE